jgi:DNA mismatch repair protein MutL
LLPREREGSIPSPGTRKDRLMQVRLLPDHVINLISAGEVVERPASVVKELLENSLDAGALGIAVELEKGGRKSITVRDDGTGMNRHDLLLAIQRHATSKLSSIEDLDCITTLGFRGEALPSIAAVSHMTVITSDGTEGWKLRMDGGTLKDVEPAARTGGTTVSVCSLFYNQPARKKFLRSEATELSWVEKFLTGCSFARTGTGFTLSHNGRELFRLPSGQSLEERVRSRYHLQEGSRFLSVDGGRGDIVVRLLCVPDQRWNSRRHQYILVNGRLVYTRVAQAPIDRFLAGPAGFPLCICRIDVPSEQVDVNAHPAKREVRFRNPREVEQAVMETVAAVADERRNSIMPYDLSGVASARIQGVSEQASLFPVAMALSAGPSGRMEDSSRGSDTVPIVQIAGSWLVSATDSGLVLVDQHAAHERILFETVMRGSKDGKAVGQQRLLIPETVMLVPETLELLRLYDAVIREAGFDFSTEGGTLILTAVPAGVRHGIDAIREVLRSFDSESSTDMPHQEQVAAATACAGSIKFGDRLSVDEARSLLDRLFTTSDPFHCPHGRPTLIEIPFEELEQRFGR